MSKAAERRIANDDNNGSIYDVNCMCVCVLNDVTGRPRHDDDDDDDVGIHGNCRRQTRWRRGSRTDNDISSLCHGKERISHLVFMACAVTQKPVSNSSQNGKLGMISCDC